MDTAQTNHGRVWERYFAFIPAIYFILLAMYDIGMDLWAGNLTWYHSLFNAVFLLPIIFRSKKVYLICGICFSVFWIYLLIAWLAIMPGNNRVTTLQALGVGAFLAFSFICSLLLWYIGVQKRARALS